MTREYHEGYQQGYKDAKEEGKEPTTKNETLVSLDVYKQVAKERDIAIQQLHELGYDFGQKIEPTTKNNLGVDCISREKALVAIRNLYPGMPRVDFNGSLRKWVDKYKPYIECDDAIKQLPSVTPQPCEDAVSRQEVLDLIADYDLSMGQVVRGIHALSSVTPQEPRWIPVSDYLPVTNDEVLVTYIVNGNHKKRYVETANCFDGEWSSVNDEYRIPNTKVEIIAWCEMPKPYREVEE